MTPTTLPDFFLPKEVSAMFRVSTMTVFRMIERGDLAAVRIGRSLRIPRAELERLGWSPPAKPRPNETAGQGADEGEDLSDADLLPSQREEPA